MIVGKRALPALALVGEAAALAARVALLARADDIVIAFGDARTRRAAAALAPRARAAA